MLDARERRDRVARELREAQPLVRIGVGWGRIVLGPVGDAMRLLAHGVRPLEGLRRREQADDDARERRMDPARYIAYQRATPRTT